jgi:hypothetical protein
MPTRDRRIAIAIHLLSLRWLPRLFAGAVRRPPAQPRECLPDFVDTQASWHAV